MDDVKVYRAGARVILAAGIIALGLALLAAITSGCASESERLATVAKTGGGAAAGAAVAGPGGAAVGGIVGYLWGEADAADETVTIQHLGFFARLGNDLDHFLLWAVLIVVAALALAPRWRVIAWDFVAGLPRILSALLKQDTSKAKTALSDMVLAPPRLIGAVRESPRTRTANAKANEG